MPPSAQLIGFFITRFLSGLDLQRLASSFSIDTSIRCWWNIYLVGLWAFDRFRNLVWVQLFDLIILLIVPLFASSWREKINVDLHSTSFSQIIGLPIFENSVKNFCLILRSHPRNWTLIKFAKLWTPKEEHKLLAITHPALLLTFLRYLPLWAARHDYIIVILISLDHKVPLHVPVHLAIIDLDHCLFLPEQLLICNLFFKFFWILLVFFTIVKQRATWEWIPLFNTSEDGPSQIWTLFLLQLGPSNPMLVIVVPNHGLECLVKHRLFVGRLQFALNSTDHVIFQTRVTRKMHWK